MNSGDKCPWDEQQRAFLFEAWYHPNKYSTAEIGRQCSIAFHMLITKNAVVGKVGRMHLTPRPSPIHRNGSIDSGAPKPKRQRTLPPAPPQTLPALASCLPISPRRHVAALHPRIATIPTPWRAPAPEPREEDECTFGLPHNSLRRSDGSGCLFPTGHPGTPSFRFCDHDLDDPHSRIYCAECCGNAYVRPRPLRA